MPEKRKRDAASNEQMNSATKSLSQLSLSQPSRKKAKTNKQTIVESMKKNSHCLDKIYRCVISR